MLQHFLFGRFASDRIAKGKWGGMATKRGFETREWRGEKAGKVTSWGERNGSFIV